MLPTLISRSFRSPSSPPFHSSFFIPALSSSITIRLFSKYLSKAATKRLPLTTKRAGKGFYKGNRCTKEGHVNSKGKFTVDHSRRLQLIVPNLEGFKLKPYIAASVPKVPPEERNRA